MASSNSSHVDPHTSDVSPHTFSDNPPHTSDADIVGPSADNTIDNHKIMSKTIESQHIPYNFEIHILDSMSTSDNVILSDNVTVSESCDTTSKSIDNHKIMSKTIESRHIPYNLEIHILDSMSTSDNVILSDNVTVSESCDTTSTGTVHTNTEHQHL
ncbi:hypothetical protein Hanom_Chr07g00642441 [Helianthus anomalus]